MLACGTFLLSSSCPVEVETQAPRLMSNYSNCKVKMHVKRTEQILAVRSAVAAAVLLLYFIEMQRKVALLMHYSDLFYIWQNLERNQQGWKIPRIKRGPSSNIVTKQLDSSVYWGCQLGPRHEEPRGAKTSRPAENVECGSTIFCSVHVPESGLKVSHSNKGLWLYTVSSLLQPPSNYR